MGKDLLGDFIKEQERKNALGFERLIARLAAGDTLREKDEEALDRLMKSITSQEIHTRDELGKLIEGILKEQDVPVKKQNTGTKKMKTPDKKAHTLPEARQEKKDSLQKLAKSFLHIDPSIRNRFVVAYDNYKKLPHTLRTSITRLAHIFKLNHIHILAVLANESNFDTKARSQVGAKGLAQLMPKTQEGVKSHILSGSTKYAGPEERYMAALRKNKDFMNIFSRGGDHENIAIGIGYLAYLHERFGEHKALRIYNGGYNYPNNRENLEYAEKVKKFMVAFMQVLRNVG